MVETRRTAPAAGASDLALAVLATGDPTAKCAAAAAAERASRALAGPLSLLDPGALPLRPARPARPVLAPPGAMKRRSLNSPRGRIALLHALAHIEFNAIDLAFDMALRFAPAIANIGLDGRAFMQDWITVGAEEARHFALLAARLEAHGAAYGDLDAHDGLWQAAIDTAGDPLARLAIAPMVLEARGLDVTPAMIAGLDAAGDVASAAALRVIFAEEHDHVRKGVVWFHAVCQARGMPAPETFSQLLAAHFRGSLKPPFNTQAREKAGLPRRFYDPGSP